MHICVAATRRPANSDAAANKPEKAHSYEPALSVSRFLFQSRLHWSDKLADALLQNTDTFCAFYLHCFRLDCFMFPPDWFVDAAVLPPLPMLFDAAFGCHGCCRYQLCRGGETREYLTVCIHNFIGCLLFFRSAPTFNMARGVSSISRC